jgi:hypothetical protein
MISAVETVGQAFMPRHSPGVGGTATPPRRTNCRAGRARGMCGAGTRPARHEVRSRREKKITLSQRGGCSCDLPCSEIFSVAVVRKTSKHLALLTRSARLCLTQLRNALPHDFSPQLQRGCCGLKGCCSSCTTVCTARAVARTTIPDHLPPAPRVPNRCRARPQHPSLPLILHRTPLRRTCGPTA